MNKERGMRLASLEGTDSASFGIVCRFDNTQDLTGMESVVGPGHLGDEPTRHWSWYVESRPCEQYFYELIAGKDMLAWFDKPDAQEGLAQAA
jgi:hypothetical protein